MHTNLFHIVLLSFFLTIGLPAVYGQDITVKKPVLTPEKQDNKTEKSKEKPTKTTKDTIKPKKDFLDSKIKRKAVDYEKVDHKSKKITLYNKAEFQYNDVLLKSGIIVIDYENNEVFAGRIRDSVGKLSQYPYFKQGSNVVEPDSIRFNFKTKKAIVWNSRTEQGEFKIKAEVTKKENDSVYFMKKVRFTTAEDFNNPEYYFQANRVKFVPRKKVVVGLTNLVISDVPTPVALPFAYFPMTETSQSGVIMPTFTDSRNRGYSLQNGGYYFALGDYYDLAILGDYYTNGSYGLRFQTNYALRYKFTGNLNFRYENLINSERGFPDYSKTNIYNIQWTHSKDSKSNPNSRFTASVNMGSSKFFQQSINQVNVGSNLNNTLNSSISYSRSFRSTPQVNLSVTATHSQNTQSQQINMTLPTLQVNVDRVFPFAPKDGIKKGFIKNINLQYSVKEENRIQTTDSLFLTPKMFRAMNSGMQHTIPLSTNFKVFKHFSVTTSLNYNEVWYIKTLNRSFNTSTNKVEDTDQNGFDAFRTYSSNSSIGTTIYGTFNFGEKKRIQSLRHVVRPNISYNYTPSFGQYFDTYALDASGTTRRPYTRFEKGIYGGPSNSMSNVIGFDINNTFEAKVRDKDPLKTDPKKIMLLNNLNLHSDYNATLDSLKWSPMRVSTGTNLFKNKMIINVAGTFDPYALNATGARINRMNIENGGSLFRMTSANLTLNYSLTNKDTSENKDNIQGERNGGRKDDLFGANTDYSDRRQSQFAKEDKKEDADSDFFKALVPYDIKLAYSITYSNLSRESKIMSNSLMVSSNIDITPKWKIGASTGYDFVSKGITFTQLRFERDLMSWRMDFNWQPFGDYAFWGFFIGVKSSVLSDIKWDKRSAVKTQVR